MFLCLGELLRSRALLALVAVLNLIPAGRVTAQTFTTLYSFTAVPDSDDYYHPNSDGAGPKGLVLSGHTLYGTASLGGSGGAGTVFAINTFIRQHPVWNGVLWRQFGQWHGIRRQHQWHGF